MHEPQLNNFLIHEPDEIKEKKIKTFRNTVICRINKSPDKATAVDRLEGAMGKLEEISKPLTKGQKKLIECYLKVDLTTMKI